MPEHTFTLIDDGRAATVAATTTDDGVRLTPAALQAALGWALKPQGFCKDERCVPVGRDPDLVSDVGVDLARFARLLSRPAAIDAAEGVAYIGAAAADRSAQLASLHAPDFTLPDLDGTLHSLSGYRGKKILLVAYASW